MKAHSLIIAAIFFVFSSCNHNNNSDLKAPQPTKGCSYARDEKNPIGKRIRVAEEEKFIALASTDTVIKKTLNGDDFLKGYLSCVSVDTVVGIFFRFKINSQDAFQYYGLIKKDNKVTFVLKSGKAVQVSFGNTFSGNTDLSKDFTEYSALAYLSKDMVKQLMSEELGRVNIKWTKKDEEYTVVNPHIFINQLPCVQ